MVIFIKDHQLKSWLSAGTQTKYSQYSQNVRAEMKEASSVSSHSTEEVITFFGVLSALLWQHRHV
jgi:hypothetical protein